MAQLLPSWTSAVRSCMLVIGSLMSRPGFEPLFVPRPVGDGPTSDRRPHAHGGATWPHLLMPTGGVHQPDYRRTAGRPIGGELLRHPRRRPDVAPGDGHATSRIRRDQ